MKKRNILICTGIMLICSSVFTFGSEIAAVWTRLYQRATTLDQKKEIMLNIVEQNSREMIPVLTDALEEEVRTYRNITASNEKAKQNALMKLVINELGRLKAGDAASIMWEAVNAVNDPLLKADAIVALGKMGARQYAEQLSLMLRNLNMNFGEIQDQRANEILAYGLVICLERLKSPLGYEPVFFAAQGWYSSKSRVKERAEEALINMVEDPTDQLISIIRGNPDYAMKRAALTASQRSRAPEDRKALTAAAALDEGLTYSPRSVSDKRMLKLLRVDALRMLKAYPQPPEEETRVVKNMTEMLYLYRTARQFDEDEMITLLDAMGTYEGDDLARALSDLMAYYNERREYRPPDSFRIVTQLIRAMGEVASPIGLEELTMVTISQYWESSIQREAKAAIKEIQE